MIYTNQVLPVFDHNTIARDFILFEARRDRGSYRTSLVPDAALQECRALSVAYDRGQSCYILYRRADARGAPLKKTLEACEDTVRVQEISSRHLPPSLLTQLLCNAIHSLAASERMYHNVTGALYYLHDSWMYFKRDQLLSFYALRISFTPEHCIRLNVRTFTALSCKPEQQAKPQYCFDRESFVLRRALKGDSVREEDRFVIAALNPRRKNIVPFLEFGSLQTFRRSKVGILQQFLRDVRQFLSPYLTLTLTGLDEHTHCGQRSRDHMPRIRRRLREVPLCLEDTVQTPESRALAGLLGRELEQFSGVSLREEAPGPGAGLLRIVHCPEYYKERSIPDPYAAAPAHCAVQHVTLEDFQLSPGAREKEDPKLRKVLQELAIKLDIFERRMVCYDWSPADHPAPLTFVTAVTAPENARVPVGYRMLRVQPDGTLEFDCWKHPLLWDDPCRARLATAFETTSGSFDPKVRGVIYESEDQLCIISDTDRFTLPDMDRLEELLRTTRAEEFLEVPPIAAALRSCPLPPPSPAWQQQFASLLERLEAGPPQITRRELKQILHLKSKLGKQMNTRIFQATGVLAGGNLKAAGNRERILGGLLDIRHFREDGTQFYYCGPCGSSLQQSLPTACVIRSVRSTGPAARFERYLPLMEVDFVRASAWTVLPFPFKYLREWKAPQP